MGLLDTLSALAPSADPAWLERIRSASFRGVPFYVDGTSYEFGPRLQRDTLIGRNGTQNTDHGEGPEEFDVDAYLFGGDYDRERDALEAALAKGGPAEMVLPFRGGKRVRIIGRVRTREKRKELGWCTISFSAVYEPEESLGALLDSAGGLGAAAGKLADKAEAGFLDKYDLSGLPGAQQLNITAALDDVVSAMRSVNGAISSQLGIIDTLSRSIDNFAFELGTLLNTPQSLVSRLRGLLGSILGVANTIKNGIDRTTGLPRQLSSPSAFEASEPTRVVSRTGGPLMLAGTERDPDRIAAGTTETIVPKPADTATDTRAQEAAAAHAVYVLTRAVGLAGVAELASVLPFDSVDLADQMMELIGDAADSLTEAPQESIDGDTLQAVEDTRAAAFKHLSTVSANLADLQDHYPRKQIPMVLIAHELYSDATRENEIIARNRTRHPLLVEANERLEVEAAR